MDLTPRETEAAHEAGERAFRDCQKELVARIAAFIERWPGLQVSARGRLRKCMARDIMSRFGTQEDGE